MDDKKEFENGSIVSMAYCTSELKQMYRMHIMNKNTQAFKFEDWLYDYFCGSQLSVVIHQLFKRYNLPASDLTRLRTKVEFNKYSNDEYRVKYVFNLDNDTNR